jgi:hypothetical protein
MALVISSREIRTPEWRRCHACNADAKHGGGEALGDPKS